MFEQLFIKLFDVRKTGVIVSSKDLSKIDFVIMQIENKLCEDWAFWDRVSLGGVFSASPRKIRSRQPRPMKLGRLIASIKFYKMCNFENQIL